ncbi:MAG: hypothetical protein AB4290_27475 [Spirulina sp.]
MTFPRFNQMRSLAQRSDKIIESRNAIAPPNSPKLKTVRILTQSGNAIAAIASHLTALWRPFFSGILTKST